MKVYCYKELRKKSIDQLDLLSLYVKLKNEIDFIINEDPENEDFYIEEHLYFYELNIRKIKNELEVKSELKTAV